MELNMKYSEMKYETERFEYKWHTNLQQVSEKDGGKVFVT